MLQKERKIQKLIRKLETLIYNFSHIEDYEEKILQAVLREQNCEELRNASLSLAECHVIDCIERNDQINTTAIAKKLNMTKGGISKITTKLLKKNMIELQRLPNNQKETYYTLTPLGKSIFRIHEVLHKQAEARFFAHFSGYNQEQIDFADKFLNDLTAAVQSTNIEIEKFWEDNP
ncbi:MAG TPA: MarR family transcriptional regulator [Selenomonadales bacterium]|nr:MarR family transcriptional regulator [Selenomonadales bacterium]